MDNTTDTLPEHIKLRLIAAAVGLQQCTQTAANIVPLPGTDRFVTIGAPAEVWQLLRRQMPAEESPPNAGVLDAETTLPEDVAAVFAACGFEIRSTDPAEKHPLAVAGSLDAAGLVVETLMTRQQAGAPALLNVDELAALRRFDECAQDGEGYDVRPEMMARLAEIGVVRRLVGRYFKATEFGQRVLEGGAA